MERKLTKILAIDDNNDNLITIKALIGESFPDIAVATALSGEDGIKIALEQSPDIILLDVVMPGMDGFEVCRRLKENRNLSDIPVIFVTALKADKESRIRALELGAEGFLAKPIDESELVAQIRAMLKIRQANVEKQNENVRLATLVAERTKELKQTHTATLNLLEDLRTENEARRKTAEALAESEARLIRAEFASKSGNWELHLDSKIMISSEGACSLYGISEKENVFDIVKEVPLPEYREMLDNALVNLIERNEPYSLEFKIRKADSGEIVDVHSIAFFDKERRIVFGVIQDITERKQAQKALYESEELYRSVINASPDNITVTDLSGNILMISPNGLALTGYGQEGLLLGRNIHEFLAPEDRIRADKNIKGMFQGIFNGSEEYGLIKADGIIVDTEINAEFVKDVNGEPKGLVFAIRDIRERKQAQDIIRESERKYRLITEKISDVVWIMDLEGRSLFVSQSVEQFSGYSVEEYLNQTIFERFTPESAQLAVDELKKNIDYLQKNETALRDFRKILVLDYVCKDGTIKTGEVLVTPYVDNNVLIGVHGVTRDVTERKRAEDALRDSEEKYRFMAENSSDVIWHMNTDFYFDYVSPSQERLNGYKPEEVVGKSLWELLGSEDIEFVKNAVKTHRQKKAKPALLHSFKFEFNVPTRFGALIWVEVSVSVHIDELGNVLGYHGVTRDITERKQAQKALQESEALYRTIIEASPDYITITDIEGRVVKASPSNVRKYGFKDESEVIGKNIADFIAPEDRERMFNDFSLRIYGTKTGPNEYKALLPDGSTFDLEVNGGLITNPEGQVIQFVSIARDITERKAVQDALIESENRYNNFINNNVDMIFVKDDQLRYLVANDSMAKFYGKTSAELLNKTDKELAAGELNFPCESSDKKALEVDAPFVIEEKLGNRIYETLKFPMQLRNNQKGIGGILRDITDRKSAEEKLNYVTRLYALLSHVNEAIVRIKDEEELLKTICELAIKYGQFRMCWIGIYDEEADVLKPATFAGYEDGYLKTLNVKPYQKPYGKGPTGRSFLEKRMIFCNNIATDPDMSPWKEEAGKRDYKSSFATPIYRKGIPYGTLTLYASIANFFNEEEQKLLSEISNNITYAIDALEVEQERKLAEEALIQSESKYREFVENSPEAIAIYSDNVVTYVNKECLRLMRANSKEDLIGMPVIDFIHPDNRQIVIERMMQVAVSQVDVSMPLVEEKYIRLDGTPIYVEVKVMPLLLDGKPAFQLTARDISDRKIIERALEQSRIELKAIYDNAPVMMCVVDKNREILFANNAFNALTGISEEIMAGGAVGGVIGCINSLDDPRGCGHGPNCKGCSLRIAMENTFNTGIDHKNVEYQSTLNIDGELKEVYLLGSTALIQTAVHDSLLLCLHDITDRKVAEDALYKSEMILRTFIDNIPFDIWARDVNTVGILENKKMVEHFGTIIGKKTAEIDRSQDEIQLYNSINERAFKGEIVDDEYELQEHGLAKYYRQIVFPIYDRTKVSGIASINIDITERKQFEKALDESQEQLKKFAAHLQSVREEERLLLAREIHDELGQILIAMKIDMGLLRQYVMKNIVEDAFAQTYEKFNNLLSLVDNTIQTARRIMTDLRPEVLDLLGFVDTVKQYAAKFEERHKISCQFNASAFPVGINADQSVALFRIVQEALNNISKHAMATQVIINIGVVDGKYVVEITDNGVGFDMTKKSRSDSYGLIGMKERVFLLGATMELTSEPGKGTVIRVEVPQSDEETIIADK